MMLGGIDLSTILEENARELIRRLLNLIEQLTSDLRASQAEVQRLRDEVNRLKGEQGKPGVKGNTPKPPSKHSSEEERKQVQPHRHAHCHSRESGNPLSQESRASRLCLNTSFGDDVHKT
ncbi:MAG: hypothetical protein JXB07_21305 [Anaerolineae bacterium]|nr:hypothetical protein [Anaerolineae bacterium]